MMTTVRSRWWSCSRLAICVLLIVAAALISIPGSGVALGEPTEDDDVVTNSDDLDGDDVADTVTADPDGDSADDEGNVTVRSGTDDSVVSSIEGKEAGSKFGESVTASWDTNGDGFKDLIVGAPLEGSGRIYVFDGPFSAQTDAELTADDASMVILPPDPDVFEFGFFVGGVPDVDGDAIPDMLVRGRFVDSDDQIRIRHYILSGFDGAFIDSNDSMEIAASGAQIEQTALSGGWGCACVGDIASATGTEPDGEVNTYDLLELLAQWGSCPAPCPPSCPADLAEDDCLINVFDLLELNANWGVCDSDGDGMPDYWEQHFYSEGVHPCIPDAGGDPDADGLSNLEEFQWGTAPGDPDSDQDGVTDGAEVIAGADPNDPSDNGIGTNSENVLYVMLQFGDHSCHNSETWGVNFGGQSYFFQNALDENCQEPGPNPCDNHDCNDPWECEFNAVRDKGPIPIERGQVYLIQMDWLATAYPACDGPDANDWTCLIDLCDADGNNRQPLIEHIINDPGDDFDDEYLPADPIDGVYIVDPAMIMGEIWNHPAPGGAAFLHAVSVGLDADSNNDGTIDSADNVIEDKAPGKLVMTNDDDDDFLSVADHDQPGPNQDEDDLVQLNLSAPDGFDVNNWTIEYDDGQVKVWTDAIRTTLIASGATQDPPLPGTVFAEAVAPSAASGDISVKLNVELEYNGGSGFTSIDTVRLTSIGFWFIGRDYDVQVDGNGLGPDNSDANMIIPSDEALNVSNFVPSTGLPAVDHYESASLDPDVFRVQLNDVAISSIPRYQLEVVRPDDGGGETIITEPRNHNLHRSQQGTNFIRRGPFHRLATDTFDDGATWPLAMPGDIVRIRYEPRYEDNEGNDVTAQEITREVKVGRPSDAPENNSQNQRKHDVRTLHVNVIVLKRFTGTGPAQTLNAVQADLQRAGERMGQAAIELACSIEMGPDGSGVSLPQALQDGNFTVSQLDNNGQHTSFSDDELAVIALKDTNPNSIDVFYVFDVIGTSDRAHSYTATGASLASAADSVAGTNWVVMTNDVRIFTLAHEFMHILLDSGHRLPDESPPPHDPMTSLFFAPTSNANSDTATKRIGPNLDTANAAGDQDTFTIRDRAEALP